MPMPEMSSIECELNAIFEVIRSSLMIKSDEKAAREMLDESSLSISTDDILSHERRKRLS